MKNRDELAEAFAVADAFVAERERRAVADPVECSACDGKGGFSAHGKPSGTIVRACEECGGTPAPKALWFGQDGGLLTPGGKLATTFTDGYSAETDGEWCEVTFRATSRAHAERIVAAALAAGRAVEP